MSLCLALGIGGVMAQTQEVQADGEKRVVLSRRECLAIALSNNPTVKVADMEITRTDYSKKETLAALFPEINFSTSYQRTLELQTMKMNMGGQSQAIKVGSDNNWSMGFSASLPLIAPQLWKSLKLSDIQILQNVESARASRLDMVNSVNQAYYTLLLAKASKQVIQENYDIAVYNADTYRKRFSQGTASEYDTLRTSVQVKNIEPELLQADIAIKQAQLQLKVLMNLDPAVTVDSEASLEELRYEMAQHLDGENSIVSNTSLRSIDIQAQQLKENVSLKKLAWIPTLAASFNYNWIAMSNGNALAHQDFNPYSVVGLQLSVPIFSGGSKYYSLKQAQVQEKEIALQRENLVNSLNMQVDLALDNIKREDKQISVSEAGMQQADKAYSIMQKSFDIGSATYLDLRDSEVAKTTAKLSYYQSIYNYLVSVSELDYLLGKDGEINQN
jgi:outer membrane protein TolC